MALTSNLAALILGNTTITRPDGLGVHGHEDGGLSGKPLFDLSTQVLKRFAQQAKGRIPLIGVGGISNAEDVIIKLKAGASLVQLYSALVFKGPMLVQTILEGLIDQAKQDGLTSITDWIGQDL